MTTSSNAPQIAQNSWIEVHGTNLANVTETWSAQISWDFVKNGLPTSVGNVSATVNGKVGGDLLCEPDAGQILNAAR